MHHFEMMKIPIYSKHPNIPLDFSTLNSNIAMFAIFHQPWVFFRPARSFSAAIMVHMQIW